MFTANINLVASAKRCPCGFYGDSTRACSCPEAMVTCYQKRLSGPILDRIDIHLVIARVKFDELTGDDEQESSALVRERVMAARQRQWRRFAEHLSASCNAEMRVPDVRLHCRLDSDGAALLRSAVDNLGLSARAYHRCLRVSRTIADLAGFDQIHPIHIAPNQSNISNQIAFRQGLSASGDYEKRRTWFNALMLQAFGPIGYALSGLFSTRLRELARRVATEERGQAVVQWRVGIDRHFGTERLATELWLEIFSRPLQRGFADLRVQLDALARCPRDVPTVHGHIGQLLADGPLHRQLADLPLQRAFGAPGSPGSQQIVRRRAIRGRPVVVNQVATGCLAAPPLSVLRN